MQLAQSNFHAAPASTLLSGVIGAIAATFRMIGAALVLSRLAETNGAVTREDLRRAGLIR